MKLLSLIAWIILDCPSYLASSFVPSRSLIDSTFLDSLFRNSFFAGAMLQPFTFFFLAAGSAQLCLAHTSFTNFFVDGQNQGDGVAIRMNDNPAQATFPIKGITNADMACGMWASGVSFSDYLTNRTGINGEHGVSRVAPVKAGSTITFEWRDHPDGTQPGAIDKSHKGNHSIKCTLRRYQYSRITSP